jgi:hypothetical protein
MTVRIEYMIVNNFGSVLTNWTTCEGSVQNDAQIYIPRAYAAAKRFSQPSNGLLGRVRIVDEQTSRIVDMVNV